MGNKILLEEIAKIKKLSGIVTEAAGPITWIKQFLGKVSKKALPAEIMKEFDVLAKNGKIKINPATKMIESVEWKLMSVEEIKLMFKWDGMFNAFKEVVTANSLPMDEAALATYKSDFKKIATAYVESAESLGQSFKKGSKTSIGGSIFMKRVVKLITPGIIKRQFPVYFQKLTTEEIKKMHGWFWLGVGDYKSVVDTFKRHGFPNALANLTGQVYQKWLFWTLAFSISNFVIGLLKDVGEDEEVYDSDIEALYDRTKNSIELAGFHWIFPSVWLYKVVFRPLLRGGVAGKRKKKEVTSILDGIKTKSQREKDALERMKASVNDTTKTGSVKSDSVNFDKY